MRKLQLKSIGLFGLMICFGCFLMSCQEDENPAAKIPVLLSFSPTSGEAGDEVTITGKDFGNATEVTINGITAVIVSNTDSEVVVKVPEGSSTGKINVKTAGGLAVSTTDFTVIVIGAVTVTSVTPYSGFVGDQVVINGTDMKTVSSVKVGNVDATIVSTTETSVKITIPEGAVIGLSNLTIVNTGGTNTTSTESVKFYVIKRDAGLSMTFDGEQEGIFTGSADPEESTIYGTSNDNAVISNSLHLPQAIDGNFFHFEGFSSTKISGNYATIVANSAAQPVGTYAEFFSGATENDIYFNTQLNLGALPEGYTDVVVGLRMRFATDDYEYNATLTELDSISSPNAKGWYNLSIPANVFVDDAAIGVLAFTDMQRIAVAVRRNYGTGGTAGVQVTEADGGVYYSLSVDNTFITVGGPYSWPATE
jgi:hypothetical protein